MVCHLMMTCHAHHLFSYTKIFAQRAVQHTTDMFLQQTRDDIQYTMDTTP
jgi:hypothetical protein